MTWVRREAVIRLPEFGGRRGGEGVRIRLRRDAQFDLPPRLSRLHGRRPLRAGCVRFGTQRREKFSTEGVAKEEN